MIVAGFGARSLASAQDFAAAFEAVGGYADALAVPEFLMAGAAFDSYAKLGGLPVLWIARMELLAVQPACLTRSLKAQAEVGVASVAEGCALAGVRRSGCGVLLGARIVGHGGRVTCARAKG